MGVDNKRRELEQWPERGAVHVKLEHEFAFVESEQQQWVSVPSISDKQKAKKHTPQEGICPQRGGRDGKAPKKEPLKNNKLPQIQSTSTSRTKKSDWAKKNSCPIKSEWRPKWLHPSSKDKDDGRFFKELFSYKNLLWAHYKAKKNKAGRSEVLLFEQNLHANLNALRKQILDGSYVFGPYKTFTLYDQKKREITTTKYPDRIVHWVMYQYLTDVFEPTFIFDSYGNRKNKGTLNGALRAQQFMRSKKNTHILKIDLSKYYFSIIHEKIFKQVSKKIKNEPFLDLFGRLLGSYKTPSDYDDLFPEDSLYRQTNEKGMPIGVLVSQICANIHLSLADRFIKSTLRIKHYLRYVDDLVLFGVSRSELLKTARSIGVFLKERLGLWLNPRKTAVMPKMTGLDFLGFRIKSYSLFPRKTTQFKIRAALACRDILSLMGLRGQCIHCTTILRHMLETALAPFLYPFQSKFIQKA
jgi:RNA-directed DNA polymerase